MYDEKELLMKAEIQIRESNKLRPVPRSVRWNQTRLDGPEEAGGFRGGDGDASFAVGARTM